MAKISTYASPNPPVITDYLLGTDVNDNYSTKNFKISDVFSITAKGSFADTTTQTVPFTNTAINVRFNTTLIENNTIVVGTVGGYPAGLTFIRQGVYSISLLPQLYKSTAGDASVDFWIKVNGSNVVGSNRTINVRGGGLYTTPHLQYYISVGEYAAVELMWASSDSGVQIATSAATGVHPSGYSVSVLASQV